MDRKSRPREQQVQDLLDIPLNYTETDMTWSLSDYEAPVIAAMEKPVHKSTVPQARHQTLGAVLSKEDKGTRARFQWEERLAVVRMHEMVVSCISISLVRVFFLCVSAQCGSLHVGVLGLVLLRCWLASFLAHSDLSALWSLSSAFGKEPFVSSSVLQMVCFQSVL